MKNVMIVLIALCATSMRAISGDETPTMKFTVDPPSHPLVDLPFSFALDMVLSPLTLGAAIYESIFE